MAASANEVGGAGREPVPLITMLGSVCARDFSGEAGWDGGFALALEGFALALTEAGWDGGFALAVSGATDCVSLCAVPDGPAAMSPGDGGVAGADDLSSCWASKEPAAAAAAAAPGSSLLSGLRLGR